MKLRSGQRQFYLTPYRCTVVVSETELHALQLVEDRERGVIRVDGTHRWTRASLIRKGLLTRGWYVSARGREVLDQVRARLLDPGEEER